MPRQNSRKVRFGDYEFDSKLEAERYMFLLSREQEGIILGLIVHPKFLIQRGAILPKNGLCPKKRSRAALIYTADFEYYYIEKDVIVLEDVKGAYTNTRKGHKAGDPIVTAASKLRMNIIQRRKPEYVLVMVMSPTWWWGEIGGHKLL